MKEKNNLLSCQSVSCNATIKWSVCILYWTCHF